MGPPYQVVRGLTVTAAVVASAARYRGVGVMSAPDQAPATGRVASTAVTSAVMAASTVMVTGGNTVAVITGLGVTVVSCSTTGVGIVTAAVAVRGPALRCR